jgi:hypothetical protein
MTLQSLTNEKIFSDLYTDVENKKEASIGRNTIKLNYNDICIESEESVAPVIVVSDQRNYENVYH